MACDSGWLSKSIFGYNNLYCKPHEPCPPPADVVAPPNVDGISLAGAAAGANALEASRPVLKHRTFNHLTGIKSVEGILQTDAYDFLNPFTQMQEMLDSGFRSIHQHKTHEGPGAPGVRGPNSIRRKKAGRGARYYMHAKSKKLRQTMTDEELWSESQENINPGLEELLSAEATIFEGLGVLKDKLDEYRDNLATLCPANSTHAGFPDVLQWASSQSTAEIGMQLRAMAILIVNGVAPKVFQAQQKLFDTHANQKPRLSTLLPDLKTAVFTFIRAAENCGFWEKVLVTTYSDFGRRFQENSRKGTDHGWGSYYFVFAKNLKKQVIGYNPRVESAALEDIVPFHTHAYQADKKAKGDLYMTTGAIMRVIQLVRKTSRRAQRPRHRSSPLWYLT